MSSLSNRVTATPNVSVQEKSNLNRSRRVPWTNYLYIVPILVFVVGLIYYGIGFTAYVSLLDWNGLSATRTFVGLQHYAMIIQNRSFGQRFGTRRLLASPLFLSRW